jgi:hypothetical protein
VRESGEAGSTLLRISKAHFGLNDVKIEELSVWFRASCAMTNRSPTLARWKWCENWREEKEGKE